MLVFFLFISLSLKILQFSVKKYLKKEKTLFLEIPLKKNLPHFIKPLFNHNNLFLAIHKNYLLVFIPEKRSKNNKSVSKEILKIRQSGLK